MVIKIFIAIASFLGMGFSFFVFILGSTAGVDGTKIVNQGFAVFAICFLIFVADIICIF